MIEAPALRTSESTLSDAVRLACRAMATRFELVIHGEDPVHLRAAGEEVLEEIKRIETKLTRFRSDSIIGRINAHAADAPVRVEAPVFDLLMTCRELWELTGGSFDISVGPLMQLWGFRQNTGRIPDPAEIEDARAISGMHLIQLDSDARTVRFARQGVSIDLGAIGKGYAADEATRLLREYGVESAFLHGGTSTVATIGMPPDADAWYVTLSDRSAQDDPPPVLSFVDTSLSVSAVWGRELMADGQSYGHVLDPRTATPTRNALLAAVQMDSATVSDALSTALLVGADDASIAKVMNRYPETRALVVTEHGRRNIGAVDFPLALQH